MRDDTWEALGKIFSLTPILKAEEVDFEEIATAEHEVGILLSQDYKEFVHRYGGAIVGPFRVFGLRKAVPMAKNEASFVQVTTAFRRQHWPSVENWAVISMDHAGNPVGLDASGKVWISDHDARAVQIIAPNFEEYLRKHCLALAEKPKFSSFLGWVMVLLLLMTGCASKKAATLSEQSRWTEVGQSDSFPTVITYAVDFRGVENGTVLRQELTFVSAINAKQPQDGAIQVGQVVRLIVRVTDQIGKQTFHEQLKINQKVKFDLVPGMKGYPQLCLSRTAGTGAAEPEYNYWFEIVRHPYKDK